MEPTRQITRILHEEHLTTLDALNRLDSLLGDNAPKSIPDAHDPSIAPLLGELTTTVGGDVSTHFAFEEKEIFPRLAQFGDEGISTFLEEEHQTMLPIGQRLADLASVARSQGFDAHSWPEFHRLGNEFVERMMSHIQKEEMGMLPVLDDLLDEDSDAELANQYLMSR